MPTDTNTLSLEVATNLLKDHLVSRIRTQERIMFLEYELEQISKKKKLTEEEKKHKEEHPINIARFKEGIAQSDIHIKNFESLIKEFTTRQQGEK